MKKNIKVVLEKHEYDEIENCIKAALLSQRYNPKDASEITRHLIKVVDRLVNVAFSEGFEEGKNTNLNL